MASPASLPRDQSFQRPYQRKILARNFFSFTRARTSHPVIGNYGTNRRLGFYKKTLLKRSNDDNRGMFNQANVSEVVNNSRILKPVMVALDGTNQYVTMGYRFKIAFQGWEEKHQKVLFTEENGILDEWWRTQIREILGLIFDVSKKGVALSGLDMIENYVIVDNRLCIVNPVCLSRQTAFKDLAHFKKFLTYRRTSAKSKDWENFLNLFPTSARNVSNLERRILQLINHPVLKSPEERVDYFRLWYDFCRPISCFKNVFRKNAADVPSDLKNWGKVIRTRAGMAVHGGSYKFYEIVLDRPKTIKVKVKPYVEQDFDDLSRYVRNILKHPDEPSYVKKKSIEIEDGLRKMLPGYLSYFHSFFAKEDMLHDFQVTL